MINYNHGIYSQKDVMTKEPENILLSHEEAREVIEYDQIQSSVDSIMSGSVEDFIQLLKRDLTMEPDIWQDIEQYVFDVAEAKMIQDYLTDKEQKQIDAYDPEEDAAFIDSLGVNDE